MQTDNLSIPGLEAARRLGRLTPRRPARAAARSSGCAAGTGGSTPDSIAGTIYQAFLLRLAREVARAAIGDRDLCRALARPRRQRLHRRTSPRPGAGTRT